MTDSEPISDLSWMLPNNQVSDASLAEALVRAHYLELHRLAAALVSPSVETPGLQWAQVQAVVLDTLAEVVTRRDRLWAHPSLRAWMARLVIQGCQARLRRQPSRRKVHRQYLPQVTGNLDGWSEAIPGEQAKKAKAELGGGSEWLEGTLNQMGPQEWKVMLLHEVHGLSEDEIGWALGILPIPVAYFVKKIRHRIMGASRKAGQAGEAELSGGSLPNPDSLLRQAFLERYPGVRLSEEEQRFLSSAIQAHVQVSQGRRRAWIFLQETALVGLVLGALFFTCRTAGLLPEEIIHRYKTPTPRTKIALPMSRPTPPAPFYYSYIPKPGETLESIARKAGVMPQDIIALNPFNHWPGRGFMLDPGASLRIPASESMAGNASPTPLTPATLPPPLTLRSNPQDILQRIASSSQYWHTLWITLQEAYYGPPGYLGPPLQEQISQVWARQPGHYLKINEWREAYGRGTGYSKSFYLDSVFFMTSGEGADLLASFPPLAETLNLFLPQQGPIDPETGLKVVGEARLTGRPALVVDLLTPQGSRASRIWVDVVTGIILRRLTYSSSSPDVVLWEQLVTAIDYDKDFPASIFNPMDTSLWGLAGDYRGRPLPQGQDFPFQPPEADNGHAPLPYSTLPNGFDFISQPVFLQWPDHWYEGTRVPNGVDALPPGIPRVSVFASKYYLGSLPLDDLSFYACRRSPDGRAIALSVGRGSAGFTRSQLYWFRLERPFELHRTILSIWVNIFFAFSPDSQRLAFFGCDTNGYCRLQILTLETGEIQVLDTGGYFPFSLAWSPDGNFLVLVVEANTVSSQYGLEVLEIQTGKKVYFSTYDPGAGVVPPDSPTLAWGIQVPPLNNIETGCMLP